MRILPFNDPRIEAIANRLVLADLKKTTNLFFNLIEDIVSQQLSGRVAEVIFKRFCELFPNSLPTPELLTKKSIEELRAVGFSNSKAIYVKNIADYTLANGLSVERFDSLSDEDIVGELTTIKGVGVWTAQMVLIFSLTRPDVFPVDDLAIRQGMMKIYGIELTGKALKSKLFEIAEGWKPNRTLGTRYVWAWTNSQKSNAVRF